MTSSSGSSDKGCCPHDEDKHADSIPDHWLSLGPGHVIDIMHRPCLVRGCQCEDYRKVNP